MLHVTITHRIYYISEDTGYSAWVHVSTGTQTIKSFAYHVGYYDDEYTAKAAAEYTANGMARAVSLAGGKP